MKRLAIAFLLTFSLSINVFALVSTDSTVRLRFQNLAHKIRLKTPKLGEGEYEIRIWNKQGLLFGDAQMLYTLLKTKRQNLVSRYIIDWDGPVFKRAIKLRSTTPTTDTLWEDLLKNDILSLPDPTLIYNKLHPKAPRDSSWTVVEADGSISVKAKKTEGSVWILDGESYYFEVFSQDDYQNHGYSNPRGYLRAKPNIAELRKIVATLDKLALAFRSSK